MTSQPSSPLETLTLQNDRLLLAVEHHGPRITETVSVRTEDGWVAAVHTSGFATRLTGRIGPDPGDEVLFDFETESAERWKTVEGDLPHAFTRSTRTNFGTFGRRFIGTAETPDSPAGYDDSMTGVLESPTFRATRRYLTLRVSGGGHRDRTYVAVEDAETGEEIARFDGGFSDWFHREVVDLGAHGGRSLRLKVVDRHRGGWGHINLGSAVLSDERPDEAVDPFAPGVPVVVASVTRKDVDGVSALEIVGHCELGTVTRTLTLDGEVEDALKVRVSVAPVEGAEILSVEDRIMFAPVRRADEGPLRGPLDGVWSQGIKARPDNMNPHWNFKSPAVLFQQGIMLAALVPDLDDIDHDRLERSPLALDLDVTQGEKPWLASGLIPFEPWSHAYFNRIPEPLNADSGSLEYGYVLLASPQPEREGYRRVVRYLWDRIGREELYASVDLQQNVRRPELVLFDAWRKEAWERYAGDVYRAFELDGIPVASLVSRRNVVGDWGKMKDDAWFNSWFQTLRTAYGWYLHGSRNGNVEQQAKAERVLNLALSAPQDDGLFPSIYLLEDDKWVRGDGWAAYLEDYHAFTASWTAYWMLRWAKDLVPERAGEIVAYCRRYADFLLRQQLPSGCIPSWYHEDRTPREEYREFNAEMAGSALFLLTLYEATGDRRYREAGEAAMAFVTREVLPRHRWYDYETFRSCARKEYDFYDSWTAQYPQNNLCQIQAAMAYEALYRLTGQKEHLARGEAVLDYLLLTQQVWNHPLQDPKFIGGFTTQNTDAEWSDARQCYGAALLFEYYRHTGKAEYLERAVAAARSTFAVAPWENWSHFGHENAPGAMTGLHWGTCSAMTSVEMMADALGDAYIHLGRGHGVGFNACTVTDVRVEGDRVSFGLRAHPAWKSGPLQVRFEGAEAEKTYEITVNGKSYGEVSGESLRAGAWPLPLSYG